MNDLQLTGAAAQWANDILVWIGFGTLTGLLAKAILPGRDPGGAVTTLAMGIVGTAIGSGLLMYCLGLPRVTPVSPIGFLAGTGGAIILLLFYRLAIGRFNLGRGGGYPRAPYSGSTYRRRRYSNRYSDSGVDRSL